MTHADDESPMSDESAVTSGNQDGERGDERAADVESADSAASARLLLVGVVAGTVLGAGVGARSLIDDVGGLWFFGMLFGAGIGALLGGVAGVVNAVVVVPRAVAVAVQPPGPASRLSVWWELAVPVPSAAVAAWWVLQSPQVTPLDRVLVTVGVAATCAAWVLLISAWALAPLTRDATRRASTAR